MKIGLIAADGHNFPNLALMKIAAFHKERGDVDGSLLATMPCGTGVVILRRPEKYY